MNKNSLIVGGILLLLILIAIGIFVLKGKNTVQKAGNQGVQENTTANQTIPPNSAETIQGTINSLLTGGKSVKCTFSDKKESASIEGTIYVANGKMRGDIKTSTDKTTIINHMVVDSQYSYLWTDMDNKGFKFTNSNNNTNTNTSQNNQAADLNKTYNYNCQGWSADNSLFTPPSNITFSTLTIPSIKPNNGTSSGISNSSKCDVCTNVPEGTARDTCKTQLNCQ
jgi:hypothetical protein